MTERLGKSCHSYKRSIVWCCRQGIPLLWSKCSIMQERKWVKGAMATFGSGEFEDIQSIPVLRVIRADQ